MNHNPKCRFCDERLEFSFCNLGKTPLSNSYLSADQLHQKEPFFDLHAYVCTNCLLVQLEEFEKPENIFSDYAYFSSYSTSWLKHAEEYVNKMVKDFGFNSSHQVVEIASNDGYLLQYFHQKGIPVLGIEPAENVAEAAREKGVKTLSKFFGASLAQELKKQNVQADLLIGNNVLAHVPNLNDFVAGLKILLAKDGMITLEFPHLLNLILLNQFDTIYHEHFSYFSLLAVEKVFKKHGLALFDVEELPTHGGSLRVYLQHQDGKRKENTDNIQKVRQKEKSQRLDQLETYILFQKKVKELKLQIQQFFKKVQAEGKTVAGYGAPAKGNTLLNFCEICPNLLPYTADISPIKQNKFLPGTRIPIFAPQKIRDMKPDYLFVLPWNLEKEIRQQMDFIRNWGGKFVLPIPELQIL
jgi:2-polyprenyl-3-methyl-5-hydroxy-6-metoxy-1,4-benzoquinol methylase